MARVYYSECNANFSCCTVRALLMVLLVWFLELL